MIAVNRRTHGRFREDFFNLSSGIRASVDLMLIRTGIRYATPASVNSGINGSVKTVVDSRWFIKRTLSRLFN